MELRNLFPDDHYYGSAFSSLPSSTTKDLVLACSLGMIIELGMESGKSLLRYDGNYGAMQKLCPGALVGEHIGARQ